MKYKHTYTQTRNDVTSCLDAKQHLTASLLLVYVVWCPQTFFPSSSFECLGRSFMRMRFFFHLLKHFHFENFTSLVHIKFTSHTQFHFSPTQLKVSHPPSYSSPCHFQTCAINAFLTFSDVRRLIFSMLHIHKFLLLFFR